MFMVLWLLDTALNGFDNNFHTVEIGVVCLFVCCASILAALRQNANRYRICVGDSILSFNEMNTQKIFATNTKEEEKKKKKRNTQQHS